MGDGMKIDRRDFLLGSLLAGGGLAAAFGGLAPVVRLARAAEGDDRYFVFCYFSGGWDILLGLDPRDPTEFHSGNLPETLIQPGYELLRVGGHSTDLVQSPAGITFGPFIGELAAHADRVAVVRGMSMETLTHEAGMRRFLTGKPPSGLLARGSSASTWLASLLGGEQLVPNLSVQVESYNVDQPTWASALYVTSVSDLVAALQPTNSALGELEKLEIAALLEADAACPARQASPYARGSEQARLAARAMIASGLWQRFDFGAATPEMEALRSHYGIVPWQGWGTPEAQAALAATAITSGITRVASIQVASGLDTHFQEWETNQGPTQERGFAAVARLMEDLAAREYGETGDSWLDHTTLVGFSEFSRTSLVNATRGRDHSLTNACFLAGAGIRGGTVIGRSSDIGMSPTTTDLETGESTPGGAVVKPEHVLQALFHDIGVTDDPADLRVPPLAAVLA